MPNPYTIYLVNQAEETQTFWCFLAPPQEVANDPGVFANSSAYLAVPSNSPAVNTFTIPVQYIVGAGASNQAVGLNIQINSDVTNPASLQDTWDANYVTVPPQEGPTMALAGSTAPANCIAIVSNGFDQSSNEINHWYANQSFGIETEAGFIGMTWSPDPQQTRTLTPQLTFYVAVGSYGSNTLANWDQVSNNCATISVPSDFNLNACTVTYTAEGGWVITAGAPQSLALTENLDWFRSPAHNELVALSYLDQGGVASDTLKSVNWDSSGGGSDVDDTYLTGSISVTTALVGAFTYFILSGVRFNITNAGGGGTVFRFSYSGTQSANAIKSLFTTGAQLLFGGQS